jgi:hypothetical protein
MPEKLWHWRPQIPLAVQRRVNRVQSWLLALGVTVD